jgi:hypothetical protein
VDANATPSDLEKWLPPPPHRETILEFLRKGRASILPRGKDEAPLVEFEDGGVMELDRVRFSEERRFYRAGQ